ncbi:PilZ domain-containing protein [Allochromatium warmingii]|uniref:PilZ domain-containing protein n=1 Tax=Allochromatium warmingii TaxID=61595 RepID=A0A1H3HKP6_ALLWA|nr:PilZ domain-containing protein [Allochromatium warmingii]SDY15795.1 PilZ domain-containing protein [Allochromatium warmingii]
MDQPKSRPKSASERRTQARIDLRIPVEVMLPGREQPLVAHTLDLSWGGALLHVIDALPTDTESLVLHLPWRGGKTIRALSQVLRQQPLASGGFQVALRFISLSPRSQNRLERLLLMLQPQPSQPGDGQPTLFRELEVTVGDAEELRQILLEILNGYYQVTVFEGYQVNQSIRLSITGVSDLPTIRLRARVLSVEKSSVKGHDWAELYTLSLGFEHPGKTIRTFIDLVLKQLSDTASELSNYSSYLEGAPGWLKSVASATEMPPATPNPTVEIRSYLESEFSETIKLLAAAWGHVTDFEPVLNNLLFGEGCGLPDGWPTEAWEELKLLQHVHEQVYGATAQQR